MCTWQRSASRRTMAFCEAVLREKKIEDDRSDKSDRIFKFERIVDEIGSSD